MIRTSRKSCVVDPRDPGIIAQKLSYFSSILYVSVNSQRDCFDTLQQQKCAQWRQHRAGVPLIDAADAPHKRRLSEVLGIDQSVIRGIWLIKHGEARRVFLPVKIAAVDDGAAERCAVPAQELRERVQNNVCAVLDRPKQQGCRYSIVDEQRET